MEAGPAAKRNPAASLTDELIVEILSRLPVRSVCRFKCVSRSWRNLISDPVHRKKLPQTLSGLFYTSFDGERFPCVARHFTNITGKGVPLIIPSFSFLPVPSDDVTLLDSCNGLLLFECRCSGPCPDEHNWYPPSLYVVCNPATEKWVMLPNGIASGENRIARLAFDPAVSLHFHVVQYELDEWVTGVEIYSSKTAAWSFKESEWDDDIILYDSGGSAFLNGFMHMVSFNESLAVLDMEGKTWRTIPVPSDGEYGCSEPGCIHQSQGRLCFLNVDGTDPSKLSIWILEDHSSHEWTLKHSVSLRFLFRQKKFLSRRKYIIFDLDYRVITFHPECNLIYFVYGEDNILIAYEMDRKEVRVIRKLGHESWKPYIPYVPWFPALYPLCSLVRRGISRWAVKLSYPLQLCVVTAMWHSS